MKTTDNTKPPKSRKFKYVMAIAGAVVILLTVSSYITWNRLDPINTCARCHEVAPAHGSWLSSAHAAVKCIECHGTALSNGLHSLKEKSGMIFTHFSGGKHHEDIRLTEGQVLEMTDNCIQCHQSEHAGWLASGHAVNYREIFMDPVHNKMEKPYGDCLRCHGMFYDGTIHDLMNLDGDASDWTIKDKKQELRPTVPCLACHQIHMDNPVSARYVSSRDTTKGMTRSALTSFYMRDDKMHLRSDMLTPVVMKDGDRQVNRATDANTVLCQQCHAPNYVHQAGSEDDRTPVGVHEGIGCTVCHKVHSGDTRESCSLCHSDVSKNCGMDVRQMSTTYLSKNNPNDIHRLRCNSCHEDR